jgi:UDP-N-acetylmuramate dehydrogenase
VQDVTRADLSRYTTLRLGGPAGDLRTVTEQDEFVQTVRGLSGREPFLILAGGSNVVIADEGLPGTVVLVRTAGVRIDAGHGKAGHGEAGHGDAGHGDAGHGDAVSLTVEAGQPWDDVVAEAVDAGVAGIECLSGVPGSAGATPIQNVGAYGQEVAEVIESVRVLDRATGTVRELSPAECAFSYRSSLFKHSDRRVVLAVTFKLWRSALSAPVRYPELARALGVSTGERAPLADVRTAVLGLRAGKGMVLDPADRDTYSVGSFFMNPVVSQADFVALTVRAQQATGTAPTAWPGIDGSAKVSAAWLIERAGFAKGFDGGHPGVAVSSKHTLALTNRGTGTTQALLDLARDIRDGVAKAFGVDLHPEPVLVGCSL